MEQASAKPKTYEPDEVEAKIKEAVEEPLPKSRAASRRPLPGKTMKVRLSPMGPRCKVSGDGYRARGRSRRTSVARRMVRCRWCRSSWVLLRLA